MGIDVQIEGGRAAPLYGEDGAARFCLSAYPVTGATRDVLEWAEELRVDADLRGERGAMRLAALPLSIDELLDLVATLRPVARDASGAASWRTYNDEVGLDVHVFGEHAGPPVVCTAHLSLRYTTQACAAAGDRYTCTFITNVPELAGFIAGVESIVYPYARGRAGLQAQGV